MTWLIILEIVGGLIIIAYVGYWVEKRRVQKLARQTKLAEMPENNDHVQRLDHEK